LIPNIRSDRGPVGTEEIRMARKRQTAGTTLIEVLVVIVIFLVGILAVVQIFPKGLNILVLARTNSVANALSRDQVEYLKAHIDQLPEDIVSTDLSGNVNSLRSPRELGPFIGDSLSADGLLHAGSTVVGDWALYSAANNTRRVLGERHAITAPRLVGTGSPYYGCLEIAAFGPLDPSGALKVYGNDLSMHVGVPGDLEQRGDDQFYVANPNDGSIQVGLPTGPTVLPNGNANSTPRTYYISFSGYIQSSPGVFVRRDFRNVKIDSVPPTNPDVNGVHPLYTVNLASAITATIGSVDLATLRVSRGYTLLTNNASDWENDEAFVYKILDPKLGVFMFSPYAFGQFVSSASGHEPLIAKFDYNVYDWRILREEFRLPYHLPPQHQLAVGSLKVGGVEGADGRPTPVIDLLEDPNNSVTKKFNNDKSDNFVLMDLDTGGVYCERDPATDADYTGTPWIYINKTTGVVTMVDLDNNKDGTQADLMLPDGTIKLVTIDSRAVRALYRTRNEMSVQVFKATSTYDISPLPNGLGKGHYYLGGTGGGGSATRIYFPVADLGQSVTFGVINYRTSANEARQLLDQQFVIRSATGEIAPFIDIATIDPLAASLDQSVRGYAVSNVKGSSISVRTLWNPDIFHLTNDSAKNMQLLDTWGRSWRQSTNETFLEQGELTR